jgi:hypothetical protein
MGFVPTVTEDMYKRMQALADRARAQDTMSRAADRVLGYAAAHADHRAEVWAPATDQAYTLEPFLVGMRTRAFAEAEHALTDMDAELAPAPLELQLLVVVPDWVNTARGAHPELNEPDWVRVWEPMTPERMHPTEFPNVGYAVALVADRRRPSLLRVDWDWCGVFPFGTPTYKPVFTTEGETRTCTSSSSKTKGTPHE